MGIDNGLSCRRVEEQLPAYFDGELRPEVSTAVDRHLATCPGCAMHARRLQDADAALLRISRDLPVSGNLLPGFHARLAAAERPRQQFRSVLAPALAAAVLALLAVRGGWLAPDGLRMPANGPAADIVRTRAGAPDHVLSGDALAAEARVTAHAPVNTPPASISRRTRRHSTSDVVRMAPHARVLTDSPARVPLEDSNLVLPEKAAVAASDRRAEKGLDVAVAGHSRAAEAESEHFQDSAGSLFAEAEAHGRLGFLRSRRSPATLEDRQTDFDLSQSLNFKAALTVRSLASLDELEKRSPVDAEMEPVALDSGVSMEARDDDRGFETVTRVANYVEDSDGGSAISIDAQGDAPHP